jgi:hypothetical protein
MEPLARLLEEANDGRIQVPEFQRELILTDEWMKSLLASVSLGYPIGAVMLLEAGVTDMRFATHPIGDLPLPSTEPERLLIDGRRRITGLYEALASGRPVQTQDDGAEPMQRWYFIDIDAALDPAVDRDEAIISAPEISGAESGQERSLFPLRLVFGADAERGRCLEGLASHSAARSSRFETEILAAFDGYLVPTIALGKETTRWSGCTEAPRDEVSLTGFAKLAARSRARTWRRPTSSRATTAASRSGR